MVSANSHTLAEVLRLSFPKTDPPDETRQYTANRPPPQDINLKCIGMVASRSASGDAVAEHFFVNSSSQIEGLEPQPLCLAQVHALGYLRA
jgi:hypothetical protein